MDLGLNRRKRTAAAIGLVLSLGFETTGYGLGVIVNGKNPGEQFLYGTTGSSLYRYYCPTGVVASSQTCTEKDPNFKIGHEVVIGEVDREIRTALSEIEAQISKAIQAGKEADPDVKKYRAGIRSSLEQVKKQRTELAALEAKRSLLGKSVSSVAAELESLSERLLSELPQAELLRLVELRAERVKQKRQLEAELAGLVTQGKKIGLEQEKLTDAITEQGEKLGKLLPTILVQSPELAALQARKEMLEAERGLSGELRDRVTDPTGFPTDVWIAGGQVGVQEIVDRFSAVACRMGGAPTPRVAAS
jgi:soluble cytochrome b562